MLALKDILRASWSSPRQVGVRVAVAVAGVVVAGVPFSLLVVLVESHWRPLLELDDSARDSLHLYALVHPVFVAVMRAISDSGSALAWQIVVVVAAAVLLWRRRVRLGLFVVGTNLGSSLVNGFVKTAVDRARPLVSHPFLHEPGQSFPSGHAQAAMVGYAVLLLVGLAYLDRRWRRVAVGVSVVMVAAIGFSRVALAAHFVSDVVAGYLLGLAWVMLMASAFHVWGHAQTQVSHAAEPPTQNPSDVPATDRESPGS